MKCKFKRPSNHWEEGVGWSHILFSFNFSFPFPILPRTPFLSLIVVIMRSGEQVPPLTVATPLTNSADAVVAAVVAAFIADVASILQAFYQCCQNVYALVIVSFSIHRPNLQTKL